ncbi:hypothetical protein [Rhizobium sp. CCGE 510]|uniref:hypothetical protein n=1 Tax=Rhizobium sp. CCGE 510 TaxID=1132836 RepID=UPI0012F6D6E0|nr:hypothetical protein [Rhizobium sp. CCGE 510]
MFTQISLLARKPAWLIAALILTAHLLPTVVNAKDTKATAFEVKIVKLLDSGDCAQAWKELWRLARQRDQKTLSDIVFAVIPYRALVPPSYFPLTENALQSHLISHMIALKLYNWKDPEVSAEFDKYGLSLDSNPQEIFANAETQGNYQRVDSCLKTHNDKETCVSLAIQLKVIPTFESYVAMMDHAPRDAFCLPLPGPKRDHISPRP